MTLGTAGTLFDLAGRFHAVASALQDNAVILHDSRRLSGLVNEIDDKLFPGLCDHRRLNQSLGPAFLQQGLGLMIDHARIQLHIRRFEAGVTVNFVAFADRDRRAALIPIQERELAGRFRPHLNRQSFGPANPDDQGAGRLRRCGQGQRQRRGSVDDKLAQCFL